MDKPKVLKINPLTPVQSGMLFYSVLDGSGSNYHQQNIFSLEGQIDISVFKAAWQVLMNRHEIFRTDFRWKKLDNPVQIVLNRKEAEIAELDFCNLDEEQQNRAIEEFKTRDLHRGFDFENGRINRITFVKVQEERYLVFWTFHHILLDGWSIPVVLTDFFSIYDAIKCGLPVPTQPVAQFSDYLDWFKKRNRDEGNRFWREYLQVLSEPTLVARQEKTDELTVIREVATFRLEIAGERSEKLQRFCRELNITLNALIETAWGVLLQRYNNTPTSCFGMTVSGRPAEVRQVERIVGLLINTLPVVIQTLPGETVRELLTKVNRKLVEMRKYEYFSLTDLVQFTGISKKQRCFDSIIVFENYPIQTVLDERKSDFQMALLSAHELTNYDLTITVTSREKIGVVFDFNPHLITPHRIQQMGENLVQLLQEMILHPEKEIAKLSLLSDEQAARICELFSGEQLAIPAETLQELLQKQVEKTPEQIAVSHQGRQKTYQELNSWANQLARHLTKTGLQSNEPVVLMLDRSLEMVGSLFAVLKAGGAFLPIDPACPAERIRAILKESKSKILITQSKYLSVFAGVTDRLAIEPVKILCLDEIEDVLARELSENLPVRSTLQDLAYVIYTSGSTGQPKGVMIEQASIVNLINWFHQQYSITQNPHVLQMTNISFDVAYEEILPTLCYGGTLFIPEKEEMLDPNAFRRYLCENTIHLAQFVPVTLQELLLPLEPVSTLQTVISGGDRLSDDLKEAILAKGYSLHNHYGPTETTVDMLAHHCSQEKVTLGCPIANMRVYVLNEGKSLQPFGVPGELCIGGIGLARGYLNRPDLDAEKFPADPFCPGQRIYRTGDLVCWHENGEIEFLGRLDHQVKIRGFRIELGEIESRLRSHPALADAVVIVREEAQGEKYLCAYGIGRKDQGDISILPEEIKRYLHEYLPAYMVPACFVELEELPLTPSGKIDRNALAALQMEPMGNQLQGNDQPPRTELEKRLVLIWQEILGVKQVGVLDHFFELGGHSLKATQLVAKVLKETGLELPLRQIFASPTIRGLAEYLEGDTGKAGQDGVKGHAGLPYSPIPRVEVQELYPVSSAQKRLLILAQLEKKNTGYNMPGALHIDGAFDLPRLEEVCRKLIRRHEALRTSFAMVEGVFMQRIHSQVDFAIQQITVKEDDPTKVMDAFIQPFDLEIAPLFRMAVVVYNQDQAMLLYDLHHSISDGISMQILTEEIQELYEGKELEPLRIQYKEVAIWQNQLFSRGEMKRQEDYWLQVFRGEIPVLNLPTDFPRPAVFQMEGGLVQYQLDLELSRKLKDFASRHGVTQYMFFMALFNILLQMYSGQEDIVVGSPIAGRSHVDLERIIGMFVNTLAMRNRPELEKPFKTFLGEVKENAVQAYENQDYPFEMLIDQVLPERVLNRNPLFDVLFVMQSKSSFTGETDSVKQSSLAQVKFTPYMVESRVAKYDLVLTVFEIDGVFRFAMEYCQKLFKSTTVERMLGHLANLAREVIEWDETVAQDAVEMKLSDFRMISPEEKNQLLVTFQTAKETVPETTVYQLFAEQVLRNPDHPALHLHGVDVTYGELNSRANQLARWLRKRGVGPETVIALLLQPSSEMVAAMLGIWKAGGAYVPIDPADPEGRVQYMVADSGATMVLTDGTISHQTDTELANSIEWFNIADLEIDVEESTNLPFMNHPRDLAYIIYTSGSTGRPKGVLTEHRGILNTVYWRRKEYQLTSEDRAILPLSYAFDGFTLNLFTLLTSGATLVLLSIHESKDPLVIQKVIASCQITYFACTPSLYTIILETVTPEDFRSVKKVTVAGEKMGFKAITISKQKNPDLEIINDYGPTESSVQATVARHLEEDAVITIGKPIANTEIYICDNCQRLLPIGVIGELCIAGEGLARGYQGMPELTRERFVPNPFVPGTRMYRTGDLARWLPEGRIEFIGRMDHQVKIRGFRIETGEIEALLSQYPGVQEAVVIDLEEEDGRKYLCAYYVCVKDRVVDAEMLRAFVAKNLPDYMIPSHIVQLDERPLTSSGKLDRKALPAPGQNLISVSDYVAPEDELENRLAVIWQEVLGIERIGVHDNFFTLGGHSLKAASLVSRMYKEFALELPIREIFQNPTIRGLAETLRKEYHGIVMDQTIHSYTVIAPIAERPFYPASSGQKRIYAVQQQAANHTQYNMPGILVIHGDLHKDRLEQVLQNVITRHESLRTCFRVHEGEIVQIVKRDIDFQLHSLEIILPDDQKLSKGQAGSWEHGRIKELAREFIQPFDLSAAPLLRVQLICLPGRSYLMYDMHHMISDGLSVQILMGEIFDLYNGREVPRLRLQYKDFAVWQEKLFSSPELKKQEEYWLNDLRDLVYTEFPRKNVVTFAAADSAESGLRFEPGLQRKIEEFCRKSGITRFTFLFAVFYLILAKKLNQTDISIGIPVSGRRDPDLEKIIGLFLNVLTIRVKAEPHLSFATYLEHVKSKLLAAYENQDYPYERLFEKLKTVFHFKGNSLFSILFNYQTVDAVKSTELHQSDEVRVCQYEAEKPEAKYDLTLYVGDTPQGLTLKAIYRRECLEDYTVTQILEAFPEISANILEDQSVPLSSIKLPHQGENILQGDFDDLFEEMD